MNAKLMLGDKELVLVPGKSYGIGKRVGNPEFFITISDMTMDDLHALVAVDSEKYLLMDLYSHNGTFIDNKRLIPFSAVKLTDDMHIRMGNTVGKFIMEKTQLKRYHDSSGFNNSDIFSSSLDSSANVTCASEQGYLAKRVMPPNSVPETQVGKEQDMPAQGGLFNVSDNPAGAANAEEDFFIPETQEVMPCEAENGNRNELPTLGTTALASSTGINVTDTTTTGGGNTVIAREFLAPTAVPQATAEAADDTQLCSQIRLCTQDFADGSIEQTQGADSVDHEIGQLNWSIPKTDVAEEPVNIQTPDIFKLDEMDEHEIGAAITENNKLSDKVLGRELKASATDLSEHSLSVDIDIVNAKIDDNSDSDTLPEVQNILNDLKKDTDMQMIANDADSMPAQVSAALVDEHDMMPTQCFSHNLQPLDTVALSAEANENANLDGDTSDNSSPPSGNEQDTPQAIASRLDALNIDDENANLEPTQVFPTLRAALNMSSTPLRATLSGGQHRSTVRNFFSAVHTTPKRRIDFKVAFSTPETVRRAFNTTGENPWVRKMKKKQFSKNLALDEWIKNGGEFTCNDFDSLFLNDRPPDISEFCLSPRYYETFPAESFALAVARARANEANSANAGPVVEEAAVEGTDSVDNAQESRVSEINENPESVEADEGANNVASIASTDTANEAQAEEPKNTDEAFTNAEQAAQGAEDSTAETSAHATVETPAGEPLIDNAADEPNDAAEEIPIADNSADIDEQATQVFVAIPSVDMSVEVATKTEARVTKRTTRSERLADKENTNIAEKSKTTDVDVEKEKDSIIQKKSAINSESTAASADAKQSTAPDETAEEIADIGKQKQTKRAHDDDNADAPSTSAAARRRVDGQSAKALQSKRMKIDDPPADAEAPTTNVRKTRSQSQQRSDVEENNNVKTSASISKGAGAKTKKLMGKLTDQDTKLRRITRASSKILDMDMSATSAIHDDSESSCSSTSTMRRSLINTNTDEKPTAQKQKASRKSEEPQPKAAAKQLRKKVGRPAKQKEGTATANNSSRPASVNSNASVSSTASESQLMLINSVSSEDRFNELSQIKTKQETKAGRITRASSKIVDMDMSTTSTMHDDSESSCSSTSTMRRSLRNINTGKKPAAQKRKESRNSDEPQPKAKQLRKNAPAVAEQEEETVTASVGSRAASENSNTSVSSTSSQPKLMIMTSMVSEDRLNELSQTKTMY